MSNNLVKINNYIQSLNPAELEMIQKQIYEIQFSQIKQALRDVKDEVNKLKEVREIDKEMQEKQLELERARHRKAENRYGYISLSDLGNQYKVSIGSKTMGILLRLAGIAKSKQSTTEPLAEMVRADFAKSQDTNWGGIIWQWNSEKCISKIDRWLEKEGLIDQFYSITDEKELMRYIQYLEETYN